MTGLPDAVVLASHTREASIPLLLLVAAGGLLFTNAGVRVWRGQVRPAYGTWFGAGHVAVPFGMGAVVLALGELVRAARDLPVDGGFYWTVSLVGFVPIAVAGLYGLVYLWVGVPDALRPPYQRGLASGEVPPLPGPVADPVDPLADGALSITRAGGRARPVVTVTPSEVVVHRRRGQIRVPHEQVADVYVTRGGPGRGQHELAVELRPEARLSTFTDRPGRTTDLDVRRLYVRPDGSQPDGPIVPMGPGRLSPDAPQAAAAVRAALDRAGRWTPRTPPAPGPPGTP